MGGIVGSFGILQFVVMVLIMGIMGGIVGLFDILQFVVMVLIMGIIWVLYGYYIGIRHYRVCYK
jgi:hypothetical protein